MRATLIASLGLLALAGCVETPPYVASSAPLPPTGPTAGGGTGGPAMPSPPLASQLKDVSASHVTQVPGHADCSDYSVTGTLNGRAETVTGRSCRLPNGGLQVTERDPATGQVSNTTYPAPPAQGSAGGPTGGGSYAATPYGYGVPYGYGYPYYYGYPYAFGDPFFFGYPFFGFGFGYGFGYGYGFHGGYGFRGGYGGGFHGGGGGFHGGGRR